jgi:hypothetical protein
MKKETHHSSKALNVVFMKSQLICAQSLEIMMERLIEPLSSESISGELCEIFEDIANIYMNLSERISAWRANEEIFLHEFAPEMTENSESPKKITL